MHIFERKMSDLKKLTPLPAEFYRRNTLEVAMDLLGKVIVRIYRNQMLNVMITETEAYIGDHDPACHSYKKFTERNRIMYEQGGKVYIYFIYGNYYCFNIVTGQKGEGNAVLIRSGKPLAGIEKMNNLRGHVKNIHDLTNGPGKLCMALGIDQKFYGDDVTEKKKIFITASKGLKSFTACSSRRIGLNKGEHLPYRFFIKDNPYVTLHKFNREIISETKIKL